MMHCERLEHESWKEELIKENEDITLSYEVVTPRKERRRLITSRDKTIRKLWVQSGRYFRTMQEREQTHIVVPLPRPIFKHYKKEYKLRDEFLRTKDKDLLVHILKDISVPTTSRRRDFLIKDYKTKKYHILKPGLQDLSDYVMQKKTDKYKREFYKFLDFRSLFLYNTIRYEYTIRYPWRFDVEKITPIYNTHQEIPLQDVLRRQAEARERLHHVPFKRRKDKAMGWGQRTKFEKEYEKNKKKEVIKIDELTKDLMREYYAANDSEDTKGS